MNKEFTKADLKYGYLVVFKNGRKALVMPSKNEDCFAFKELAECLVLEDFDENLRYVQTDSYDVKKVYGFAMAYEALTFSEMGRDLIWQRKEVKRMTVAEMRQKLEELTGEKIEVEPSRNDMIYACIQYCGSRNCEDCEICEMYGYGDFEDYSDDMLKQCYEKVIADGNI